MKNIGSCFRQQVHFINRRIGSVDAANWYTVGNLIAMVLLFIDNDSAKKMIKKAVMDIKAMDYEGYHYIVTEEFNFIKNGKLRILR